METILYAIGTILATIAAILAWIAKIKWSNEFSKAKNAQIESLKCQIENLTDLTPMKIKEYFLSVKSQLEEYNDFLKNQLSNAKAEIESKETKIIELNKQGNHQSEKIDKLNMEKNKIAKQVIQMEVQLNKFEEKYESEDNYVIKIPKINPEIFESISLSSKSLMESINASLPTEEDIFKLSDSLEKQFESFSLASSKIPNLFEPFKGIEGISADYEGKLKDIEKETEEGNMD